MSFQKAASIFLVFQFSSVAQLCPTLCNMPGFPVHHQLLELAQTHVHQVSNAKTVSFSVVPFSSCLQSFPASGPFPMSQFFASGGQSIGASVSVLPMNTQDWFPLGWTGWISLQPLSHWYLSLCLLNRNGPSLMELTVWATNAVPLQARNTDKSFSKEAAGTFYRNKLTPTAASFQWMKKKGVLISASFPVSKIE